MTYFLYYDEECATCKEFIRIFQENNIDVQLRDINLKVGDQPGAYRWQQIDITKFFNFSSSFIPMIYMEYLAEKEEDDIKRLFVGGSTEQQRTNSNKDITIFTSHEEGMDKLQELINKNKKSTTHA